MLKMKSILNVSVNGREYEMSFLPDSPITDILEANNQMNAFVLGRAEQAKIAQAAQASQECPACPEMPPAASVDQAPQG